MTKQSKRSSSKKTNKSKMFGKNIYLKSRKAQFFFSIAIFALLGGGWLTYRSFAATGQGDFTVANGGLKAVSNARVINDPNKNNTAVLELRDMSKFTAVNNGATLSSGQPVQYCVMARYTSKGKRSIGSISPTTSGRTVGVVIELPETPPNSGYNEYCSPIEDAYRFQTGRKGPVNLSLHLSGVSAQQAKNSITYISSFKTKYPAVK